MTDNIDKQVHPHIADSAFGTFGELQCTAIYCHSSATLLSPAEDCTGNVP